MFIDYLYYTTHSFKKVIESHWNIKKFGLFLFNSISKCLIGECEKEKREKVFRVYGNRFDGGGYKDCKYEFMS